MTIGERIRARRIDIGLSQTELADRADIAKQNLYKYEKNVVTNIPTDVIERLAEALHTSPAYLMGWAERAEATPFGGDMTPLPTGEKIKRLRRQNNLTQEDLGQRLGVTTTTISKWECGRVIEIPSDQINAMAALFDVDPAYLLDDEDPEKVKVSTFSARLDQALAFRRLTIGDLLHKANITSDALQQYMLNDSKDGPALMQTLGSALGVSPDWLQGYAVPRGDSGTFEPPASEPTADLRFANGRLRPRFKDLLDDELSFIRREMSREVFDSSEMEKLRISLFFLGFYMEKDDDQDGFIKLRMTGYNDPEASQISLLPPKKSEIRAAEDIFDIAENVIFAWINSRARIFAESVVQGAPDLEQSLAGLNEKGKEKVAEYVQDLLSNESYTR